MAYEAHSPYTLDELDETIPTSLEDISLYDEALRQTRTIIKEVFLLEHNADGTHRWGAETLATNSVTGAKIASDTSDDAKRAIGSDHIKTGAITAGKLATDSVLGAAIKDLEVTSAKLHADIDGAKLLAASVVGSKMAAKSVTDSILSSDVGVDGNRAVDTDHIKDEALTARHFPDKCVPTAKISMASSRIMVGGRNGTGLEAVVGGNVLMAVDEAKTPPVAVFSVNVGEDSIALPYATLKETCPTFPNGGGDAVADQWATRPAMVEGSGRAWIVKDKFDVIDVYGSRIRFNKAGRYLVLGWALGFKCGMHQVRIYRVAPTTGTLLAGGMVDADASIAQQSASLIQGFITVSVGDEVTFQHWTEATYGVGGTEYHRGLGRGPTTTTVNNNETLTLASLIFIKIG